MILEWLNAKSQARKALAESFSGSSVRQVVLHHEQACESGLSGRSVELCHSRMCVVFFSFKGAHSYAKKALVTLVRSLFERLSFRMPSPFLCRFLPCKSIISLPSCNKLQMYSRAKRNAYAPRNGSRQAPPNSCCACALRFYLMCAFFIFSVVAMAVLFVEMKSVGPGSDVLKALELPFKLDTARASSLRPVASGEGVQDEEQGLSEEVEETAIESPASTSADPFTLPKADLPARKHRGSARTASLSKGSVSTNEGSDDAIAETAMASALPVHDSLVSTTSTSSNTQSRSSSASSSGSPSYSRSSTGSSTYSASSTGSATISSPASPSQRSTASVVPASSTPSVVPVQSNAATSLPSPPLPSSSPSSSPPPAPTPSELPTPTSSLQGPDSPASFSPRDSASSVSSTYTTSALSLAPAMPASPTRTRSQAPGPVTESPSTAASFSRSRSISAISTATVSQPSVAQTASASPSVAATSPSPSEPSALAPSAQLPKRDLSRLVPGTTYSRCVIPGVIAMCIDDGWIGFWEPTLDALRDAKVPVTFFNVAMYLSRGNDRIRLAKRAISEGHSMQHYTWNHSIMTDIPPAAMRFQLDRAMVEYQTLSAPDDPIRYFRPPQGKYNDAVLRELKTRGLVNVMWSYSLKDTVSNCNCT